jgi:hypothetical protein
VVTKSGESDDDHESDQQGGSDDEGDSDDNVADFKPSAGWPAKPADYDSDEDFENMSTTDFDSVEQFKAGEYVCLMAQGDPKAYAMFKVQTVNMDVYALHKSPCGLKHYGPGVYALVQFCHLLEGVCTIQVL